MLPVTFDLHLEGPFTTFVDPHKHPKRRKQEFNAKLKVVKSPTAIVEFMYRLSAWAWSEDGPKGPWKQDDRIPYLRLAAERLIPMNATAEMCQVLADYAGVAGGRGMTINDAFCDLEDTNPVFLRMGQRLFEHSKDLRTLCLIVMTANTGYARGQTLQAKAWTAMRELFHHGKRISADALDLIIAREKDKRSIVAMEAMALHAAWYPQ